MAIALRKGLEWKQNCAERFFRWLHMNSPPCLRGRRWPYTCPKRVTATNCCFVLFRLLCSARVSHILSKTCCRIWECIRWLLCYCWYFKSGNHESPPDLSDDESDGSTANATSDVRLLGFSRCPDIACYSWNWFQASLVGAFSDDSVC